MVGEALADLVTMREKEGARLALEAKSRELEALFQNLDEVDAILD